MKPPGAAPQQRPLSADITFLENWTWRHGGAPSAALAAAQPPSVHQQEDATILAVCATGERGIQSLNSTRAETGLDSFSVLLT